VKLKYEDGTVRWKYADSLIVEDVMIDKICNVKSYTCRACGKWCSLVTSAITEGKKPIMCPIYIMVPKWEEVSEK